MSVIATKTTQSLSDRLTAYSPKVAMPLQGLLDRQLLDPKHLEAILDAGELAGERHHLLGFSVAYLSLVSQSIPVCDTIAMAKQLGLSINLGWSPARWREMHNRYARAITLKKLAEDNATYDLATYRLVLPERWSGYLIPNSRRLGMEGLRQRHCVAAYDQRIRNGSSAICVVFVDRTRWTVELKFTVQGTLRIVQIRTRYNKMPDAEVKSRIFEILNIEEEQSPLYEARQSSTVQTVCQSIEPILDTLAEQGVEIVDITFCGGGDDGSIDQVIYNPGDKDLSGIVVEYEKQTDTFQSGSWVPQTVVSKLPITDVISDCAYDFIQTSGIDWYNNDGGFGEVQINVQNRTIELEVNINVQESYCEHQSVTDIGTAMQIE